MAKRHPQRPGRRLFRRVAKSRKLAPITSKINHAIKARRKLEQRRAVLCEKATIVKFDQHGAYETDSKRCRRAQDAADAAYYREKALWRRFNKIAKTNHIPRPLAGR